MQIRCKKNFTVCAIFVLFNKLHGMIPLKKILFASTFTLFKLLLFILVKIGWNDVPPAISLVKETYDVTCTLPVQRAVVTFATIYLLLGHVVCMQCIDAACWYRCQSVCFSVCVYVGHIDKLCKNGWSDRDAFCGAYSCEPKVPYIWWGSRSPMWRGIFEGDMCRFIVTYLCMSAFYVARLLPLANVPAQPMQQTNAFAQIGVTRWRCDLLPNYFGHCYCHY